MVMVEQKKISLSLLILFCCLNHKLCAQSIPSESKNININGDHMLIGMGIILDMESWIGKSIHKCITMAISDFYDLNHSYKTRIVVHTRDSKGDLVKSMSAVDDLLKNVKVQAIIGPETHLQSKLLSVFANKAKVPIFSFAGSSSKEYPYMFQIKEEESTMAKSIAALVESYKWRNVIFVHEDTDDGSEILLYLAESFQDKNIQISYRSAISASATLDDITKELKKFMTFHTTVIIVHMSPSLASKLFLKAKSLQMISEEYGWILTEKTVDLFRSTNFEVIESLQGALGFRSYVPASSRLYNLTLRWHNFFYRKFPTLVTKEVPVSAIWAYDTIWALALAVEKVGVPHNGLLLLHEVLETRFKGISGEFDLSEGKVRSNGYEIMNAIDYGEKRVGYWTHSQGIRSNIHLYSSLSTEATTAPKGFDVEKNVTTAVGFSVDVFKTCIDLLPYEVPYVFISFENATYDDLVQKVYAEPMALLPDRKLMQLLVIQQSWPTDLTAMASLILTGFVVWAIECMNQETQCSPAHRLGTIFWHILLTIFFAQREKLSSNLSRFVMFIWLLIVLILITSYTATLTSLLTVEQFELASKGGIVGFHGGSFMGGVTVRNVHFEGHQKRAYYSYEDYAHALSKDGDADAIVDEIPYIKMFLSKYPGDYALVSSEPITSGFAFIFQKGSPLVEDVSRVIAKIRLDKTLESVENRWFENRLSVLPRNSTMPQALKLDRFGGLFIISGITCTLALMMSVLHLLHGKMEVYSIISFLVGRNLMATIRYLLYRNVVQT
ncbi:unnamed protein product [Lactuca virosa]|uniref:Glutamate receptor n=1 Tax=Lactuca virosa TaxID=75947 RepID=A0AAU9N5P5_9ASTR|nr:unnamed protein product [Lactuca virosa]